MRPVSQLSPEYHAVEQRLDNGWVGTYGDLAVVNRPLPAVWPHCWGRLVKSYAVSPSQTGGMKNVFTKATGRPAYEKLREHNGSSLAAICRSGR